jgi:hypothetical protein
VTANIGQILVTLRRDLEAVAIKQSDRSSPRDPDASVVYISNYVVLFVDDLESPGNVGSGLN